MKRSYDGASYDRLAFDWITGGVTSADSELYQVLRTLRIRSRDLIKNHDYIGGAVGKIVNNVVGEGIGFQSQVKRMRGEGLDSRINSLIEDKWREWGESGCDCQELMCFADLEQLIFRSLIESGEVFVRLIYQPFGDSQIPLSLEIIEADQLCDEYSVGKGDEGNITRMGVEVDSWRRRVAYHFYTHHPGDYYFQNSFNNSRVVRVPASEVFHLFLSLRVGQTRGVPWLAPSILRCRNLSKFEEAELVKARLQAAYMGFVQSPEPDSLATGQDASGQPVRDFSPGEIFQLGPGETFEGFAPTSPGQQFDPFVRAMLRGISAGLGLSYESLSNDYSNTSYSSARQSIMAERDVYKVLQSWFIRNFHKKLYRRWLEMAVLAGELPLRGYETNPSHFNRPKFIPRRWDWVDPVKDVNAKVTAIENGITSLTQVIAETGRDIEDVFQEKEQEKAMLQKLQPEDSLIKTESELRSLQLVPQWNELAKRSRGGKNANS